MYEFPVFDTFENALIITYHKTKPTGWLNKKKHK